MSKHVDTELINMLESTVPPVNLETIAIFRAAVMKFQSKALMPSELKQLSKVLDVKYCFSLNAIHMSEVKEEHMEADAELLAFNFLIRQNSMASLAFNYLGCTNRWSQPP